MILWVLLLYTIMPHLVSIDSIVSEKSEVKVFDTSNTIVQISDGQNDLDLEDTHPNMDQCDSTTCAL
jgi:hypothetical protein